MGDSPRPGVFALERSRDQGKTWQPWQFFADTPSDCDVYFGRHGYSDRVDRDDSVICTTEYSNVVPLESGEASDPLDFSNACSFTLNAAVEKIQCKNITKTSFVCLMDVILGFPGGTPKISIYPDTFLTSTSLFW